MNKKQADIYFKKAFGKQAVLCNKKYSHLLAVSTMYDIPYDFINRCYKRYINAIQDNHIISELCNNGYQMEWFKRDRDSFSMAIKIWTANHNDEYEHYDYKKYSYGDVNLRITEISGFNKWVGLYTDFFK